MAGAEDATVPAAGCDLILIDDIQANRDTLRLLRTLKNAGALAKTVTVSSNPRVERTKERKLLGLHDLIPKPYTPASLQAEISRTLSSIRHAG